MSVINSSPKVKVNVWRKSTCKPRIRRSLLRFSSSLLVSGSLMLLSPSQVMADDDSANSSNAKQVEVQSRSSNLELADKLDSIKVKLNKMIYHLDKAREYEEAEMKARREAAEARREAAEARREAAEARREAAEARRIAEKALKEKKVLCSKYLSSLERKQSKCDTDGCSPEYLKKLNTYWKRYYIKCSDVLASAVEDSPGGSSNVKK